MRKGLLIALFALFGCAGTNFSWDSARQIKPGMSEAEVTALVGPPYMTIARGDLLVYTWSYASTFGGTRALSIPFRDGKVVEVPNVPATFK